MRGFLYGKGTSRHLFVMRIRISSECRPIPRPVDEFLPHFSLALCVGGLGQRTGMV
jgi:hypothetical protein